MDLPEDWKPVWEAARAARQRAHAPYSRFQVGAALRMHGVSDPIPGCNVENASYGGTVCAERNAVFTAVGRHGARPGDFTYLVLVTDTPEPTVPCAFCLQVLAEFCPPPFPIFLGNLQGITEATRLGALLPRPFLSFSPDPH
jgi:homotetrameric cytidine deaminase